MGEEIIARRKVLKYFALLAGTTRGREFLASWLPSAPSPRHPGEAHHAASRASSAAGPAKPYVPQFFKPQAFRTVEILTEIIIPTDDKPGAREAKVAEYIDFVVFSAAEHRPELQKAWTDGLALLDRMSKAKYGSVFRNLSVQDREQLLTEMSLPERNPKARHPGFDFFRLVKEMTVEGFYTSKAGLIDVLEYEGLSYLSDFPGCTHPEHH